MWLAKSVRTYVVSQAFPCVLNYARIQIFFIVKDVLQILGEYWLSSKLSQIDYLYNIIILYIDISTTKPRRKQAQQSLISWMDIDININFKGMSVHTKKFLSLLYLFFKVLNWKTYLFCMFIVDMLIQIFTGIYICWAQFTILWQSCAW